MVRRIVPPAASRISTRATTPEARAALLAGWKRQWAEEAPNFDTGPLEARFGAVPDAVVALLAASAEERTKAGVDTCDAFAKRLETDQHQSAGLALALRDPALADLVFVAVLQTKDPAAFPAFVSLVTAPGAAHRPCDLVQAVTLFGREEDVPALGDEPPCHTEVVRLPDDAKDTLFQLLDHDAPDVRAQAANALLAAAQHDTAPLDLDPLIARATHAEIAWPASMLLGLHRTYFGKSAIELHVTPLRAHMDRTPSGGLLACLAVCGDMATVLDAFDSLSPADRQGLVPLVLTYGAALGRTFLLDRLKSENTPIDLRVSILNTFQEHGLHGFVRAHEARLRQLQGR